MRSERERESNYHLVCIDFIQQSSGQACTHRKCLQVAKMDQDKTTVIGQLFTEVGNCGPSVYFDQLDIRGQFKEQSTLTDL